MAERREEMMRSKLTEWSLEDSSSHLPPKKTHPSRKTSEREVVSRCSGAWATNRFSDACAETDLWAIVLERMESEILTRIA